LSFAS